MTKNPTPTQMLLHLIGVLLVTGVSGLSVLWLVMSWLVGEPINLFQ